MLESDVEPAPVDFIRSMKRLGFSKEEIYDTLTGTGLDGEEVELLMDRVEINFQDMKFESRVSRLGEEVKTIFEDELREKDVELNSKFRILRRKMESLKSDIEKLEGRMVELQRICIKGKMSETEISEEKYERDDRND